MAIIKEVYRRGKKYYKAEGTGLFADKKVLESRISPKLQKTRRATPRTTKTVEVKDNEPK